MTTMAYVFGQPGAGKTTLMRAICERSQLFYEADAPIKHRCLTGPHGMFAVLGADAFPFGGTDTLSYTSVSTSERWLESLSLCAAGRLVFAEGDRLANDRFFAAARKHYRLVPVYLNCDGDLAAKRRAARAAHHRLTLQSPAWVKGRTTKHANLAARNADALRLDARQPAEKLAEIVWSAVLSESA
jgi:gluconate kinase